MTNTTYTAAYLPVVTGDTGTWGTKLNTLTFVTFDSAIGGIASQTLTNADVTLSATQSGMMILALNGTLAANVTVTTSKQGICAVENYTTGNYTVTYTNGVGATVVLPQGYSVLVASDATAGCFMVAGAPPYVNQSMLSQNVTALSSSLSIDMSKGWIVNLTLSANVTSFSVTNWPSSGVGGKLFLNITNAGSYNITVWPGTTHWTFGVPPTLTTGVGASDTILLISNQGGTQFLGYYTGKAFS